MDYMKLLRDGFSAEKEFGPDVERCGSFYSSYGLFDGDEQLADEIKFDADEWEKFINAIIAFANIGGQQT